MAFSMGAMAHDMTPTYPEVKPYTDGIYKIETALVNRRSDVKYYEYGVFDEFWKELPFVVPGGKIVNIEYLDRKDVHVFIGKNDKDRVTYVCSGSKLLSDETYGAGVSSRICSKVKR